MNNKQLISILSVGLSVTACFVLTIITYVFTHSVISLVALIISLVGVAVFWIAFIIEIVKNKINKK